MNRTFRFTIIHYLVGFRDGFTQKPVGRVCLNRHRSSSPMLNKVIIIYCSNLSRTLQLREKRVGVEGTMQCVFGQIGITVPLGLYGLGQELSTCCAAFSVLVEIRGLQTYLRKK